MPTQSGAADEGGEGRDQVVPRGGDLSVRAADAPGLPEGGLALQIASFWTAFGGAFPLGLGFMESEPFLVMVGGLIWIAAAALFGWGRVAKRERKRAIHEFEERNVVRAAVAAGGILTATALAAEMDVSISAAEALLLRMEDGLRVTSGVRSDGTLVFEFPEISSPRPTLRDADGGVRR